nr:hypothetical protein [Tanacetum cinerariifolium]
MTLRHRDTINAVAAQRSTSSSSITSSSDQEIIELKAKMAKINKNLMKVLQINQHVKAVTPSCETYGGPHSYNDCAATVGQTQNVYAVGAYQGGNSYQPQAYQGPAYQASGYQAPVHQPPIPQPQVMTTAEFTNFMKANDAFLKNMQTNITSLTNSNLELKNMFGQFIKMNTASSSGSRTLPSNTVTNPKEDLKGITTQSGTAYQGPTIPTTSSSSPQVVERETEPVVALVIELVATLVSASKPNQKPSIPYTSRLHDQKLYDKANDQKEKIFKIFQDLNFNISFADDLILMPKFGPSIKSLLTNKDKLFELARTSLNEYCSAPSLRNSNLELKNMFGQFMKINTTSSSGSGTIPSNTITNPKEDLNGITTRSGNAYKGPTIPTTSSSIPKVVERETEVTKDTVPPTNNGSTKDAQPQVVQIETLIPNFEPIIAPVAEPVVAP